MENSQMLSLAVFMSVVLYSWVVSRRVIIIRGVRRNHVFVGLLTLALFSVVVLDLGFSWINSTTSNGADKTIGLIPDYNQFLNGVSVGANSGSLDRIISAALNDPGLMQSLTKLHRETRQFCFSEIKPLQMCGGFLFLFLSLRYQRSYFIYQEIECRSYVS